MTLAAEPQTFAAPISVCAKCGREVQGIRGELDKPTVILPCGHAANISITPNPKATASP
jgi:hypothetical protein